MTVKIIASAICGILMVGDLIKLVRDLPKQPVLPYMPKWLQFSISAGISVFSYSMIIYAILS
jgi:hypothetical protein